MKSIIEGKGIAVVAGALIGGVIVVALLLILRQPETAQKESTEPPRLASAPSPTARGVARQAKEAAPPEQAPDTSTENAPVSGKPEAAPVTRTPRQNRILEASPEEYTPSPTPEGEPTHTEEYSLVNVEDAAAPQRIAETGTEFSLDLSEGEKRFSFQLKGSPAGDVWPEFAVLVDGSEVYRSTISTNEWQEYSLSQFIKGGMHKIELKCLNESSDEKSGEERTLDVKSFRLTPAGGQSETQESGEKSN